MKRLILLCCMISLLSFAAGSTASAQVLLRWKFTVGDQYSIVLSQNSTIATEANTRTAEISNELIVEMDWRVQSVENDRATIELSYRRIAAEMSAPASAQAEPVQFDTASPQQVRGPARELRDGLQPLLERPFTIVMDDRGALQDVQIPEQTMQSLREAPSSMRIRRALSAEGLREIFGQSTVVLPERQVQPGEQWTSEREFQSPLGNVNQTNVFTFAGVSTIDEREIAELTVQSTLDLPKDAQADTPLAITRQSSSGTMLFDQHEGYFRSSRLQTELDTQTPYRDMTINAQLKSELTLTIEKR